MKKHVRYSTLNLNDRTLVVDPQSEVCLSLNTSYFQKMDMENLDNEINKIFKKYEINKSNNKRINSLYLFITDSCNLSCKFCSMRSNNKNRTMYGTISLDLLNKKIIPFINYLKPRRIIISGGEPLLYKGLSLLVQQISQSTETLITIQSNGLLISDKIVFELKDQIYSIEISTAHFNNKTEELIEIIKEIVDNGIHISLSFVYDNNLLDLYKIVDIVYKYNIGFILNFISPTGSALDNHIDLLSSNKKLNVYYQLAKYINDNEYYESTLINLFIHPIKGHHSCNAYGKMLSIYPNGNIFICHSLNYDKFNLGNIFDNSTSFLDIQNNWDVLLKLSEVQKLFCIDSNKLCRECKFKPICEGICCAESYNKMTMDCLFMKVRMVFNILYDKKNLDDKSYLKNFISFYENKEYLSYI